MNDVIAELLHIIEEDPLPVEDTSSHWEFFGNRTIVESDGDKLVLSGDGFGAIQSRSRAAQALNLLERLSYWPTTYRLRTLSSILSVSKSLIKDLSGDMSFDTWKQTVALSYVLDHCHLNGLAPQTFAVIGDGPGFLSTLIRRQFPNSRIYCIDLPKILIFQAQAHMLSQPDVSMSILSDPHINTSDVTFVQPKDIQKIPETIDCAFNICSMQEMGSHSIEEYFKFLRDRSTSTSRFYCVNRLSKKMPDGQIINFLSYPWQQEDLIFIDGLCPYYRHWMGRTSDLGPRAFGVRIPLVNYFDGPIHHRLVHLDPL